MPALEATVWNTLAYFDNLVLIAPFGVMTAAL
jgi:hypothetical protein